MRPGTIILGTYIGVITVAFIVYPLIILHGYRAWWAVTFYAVLACAAVGGTISHYRTGPRNGEHAGSH